MSDTIQKFPNVVLAEVPCPVVGCTAVLEIEGALIIGRSSLPDGSPFFKMGSMVDSAAIELHMVEHGLDPQRREAPE